MEDLRSSFRKVTKRSVKKGLPVQSVSNGSPSLAISSAAYESWMATARRQTILPYSGLADYRASVASFCRQWRRTGPGHVSRRQTSRIRFRILHRRERILRIRWVHGWGERYRPTHVLQYVAIQEAIERGMTAYTLGELE